MAKPILLKNLYLGKLVVRYEETHPVALGAFSQVYTIGIIRKLRTPEISNTIYLIWFEGNIKRGYWEDYSNTWWYEPTLLQIERSICGGRLASTRDITGVIDEVLT